MEPDETTNQYDPFFEKMGLKYSKEADRWYNNIWGDDVLFDLSATRKDAECVMLEIIRQSWYEGVADGKEAVKQRFDNLFG